MRIVDGKNLRCGNSKRNKMLEKRVDDRRVRGSSNRDDFALLLYALGKSREDKQKRLKISSKTRAIDANGAESRIYRAPGCRLDREDFLCVV